MNKSITNLSTCPVIAGVQITTDDQGRYNLNALHKASGYEKKNSPSYWLSLQNTQELINELGKDTTEISVVTKEGRNGGTFAHELLAISYAGWINPKFQLMVNQVFLDYKKPQKQSLIPNFEDPVEAARAWADEKEKTISLTHQVEEMKDDVKAFERIAKANGAVNLTMAAKAVQYPPRKFNFILHQKGWIYKTGHKKQWMGYQDKVKSGYLTHKVYPYKLADGTEMMNEQVMVTPKGLTKISQILADTN